MKTAMAIFTFLLIAGAINSQTSIEGENAQHNIARRYALGVIPALNFDADLGFRYGGVFNFFDYGQSKSKAVYDQFLQVRLINSTGGTLLAQGIYESTTLIKNKLVIAESSYLVDTKMDFFGFNGRQAVYHAAFSNEKHPQFISEDFYTYKSKKIRLRLDVQHPIKQSNWRLLTGYTFNHFKAQPNSIVDENSPVSSLFENYKSWGLIRMDEMEGGIISLLTLGLVYDTRNQKCYCTEGVWFEGLVYYAPQWLGSQSFSKLVLTYRQHKSIINEQLTFSFRISSQQKLTGQIPFYMLPTIFDSQLKQDGIGGAYSLRGAFRNRLAADGFVISSFETKLKFWQFNLFKQEFFLSAALFYDNAYITQSYQLDLSNVPDNERAIHFNNGKQALHHSWGPGLYIVFNKNNIITVNYGFVTNQQDGRGGLYIGSSLLF
jgi:hypothetical protein